MRRYGDSNNETQTIITTCFAPLVAWTNSGGENNTSWYREI